MLDNTILQHEWQWRLGVFLGLLAVLAVAEVYWPRRKANRPQRWPVNFSLALIYTLVMRLVMPVAAVSWATTLEARQWGLLHLFAWPDWISWLETLLAVLLLDLAIYWQHRLMHAIPWLWRLHRVHHSDLAFDVTTGLRFHPGEILVSMLLKLAILTLLGASPLAVLMFELLLSAASLWEHANLRLPPRLEQMWRQVNVTPDMHRIHHSVQVPETNSNFGFCLSWWDHLFGSYRAQPQAGQEQMAIGLQEFRTDQEQSLTSLLRQPLQ